MTLNHIEPSPAEKARLLSGRGTHVWILEMPKPSGQDPAIKDIIKRYLLGDFKIIKNANGKPLIAANLDKELHISITHSGTIMVLALSFQKPFGIDIETLKERAHLERLRKRYFTEATPTLLDFYHAWTAREAFIKALGERLFLLKKIRVLNTDQSYQIGIDHYSHHVFFHQWDNYLLAICLDKLVDTNLKYFYL